MKVLAEKLEGANLAMEMELAGDGKAFMTPIKRTSKVSLTLKPYIVKVQEGMIYIKVKVCDTLVLIKARVAGSGALRRLEPYAVKVMGAIEPLQCKVGEAAVLAKAKYSVASGRVLAAHLSTQKAIDECVGAVMAKLAATASQAQLTLLKIAEPVQIVLEDGCVVVSGKAGDAVVYVRARRESTKAAALEAYAAAAAKVGSYVTPALADVADRCKAVKVKASGAVEPYYIKVQDGVASVKGKVGDAEVYIRAKVSDVVGRALSGVEPYCLPLYVKVKDGYLYLIGGVGSSLVYIRTEIANTYDATKVKALESYTRTAQIVDGYASRAVAKVLDQYLTARAKAATIADGTTTVVKTQAAVVSAGVRAAAKDQKCQATAAAATGGAVALGASAGAAGFVTGGTIGAAMGVVPALFTFGLSIPIGAAIGAGTGLVACTAAGGTVGLVGGGAVGYGAHTHKAEIGNGVQGAITKVSAAKDYVRDRAGTSTTYLKSKIVGGTGGTA